MVIGFKDDKGKFRPTGKRRLPLSSLELKNKNDNSSGIEHIDRLKKQKSTIEFDEAFQKLEDFLSTTDLKAFTFDPETNKGFDFFKNKNDAKEFHKMFVVPKGSDNPVYTVGITNITKLRNKKELRRSFDFLKNKKLRPEFGFFINTKGKEFTDITVVVSGVSKNEAIWLGKQKKQESILEIFKNGEADIIIL